jgi:hypothetical protein
MRLPPRLACTKKTAAILRNFTLDWTLVLIFRNEPVIPELRWDSVCVDHFPSRRAFFSIQNFYANEYCPVLRGTLLLSVHLFYLRPFHKHGGATLEHLCDCLFDGACIRADFSEAL